MLAQPSPLRTVLRRNRDSVLERVRSACVAAEREPDAVALVAVTKSVGPDVALELAALGQTDLGESRLHALEAKRRAFDARAGAPEVRWHFIGHLQRNKAGKVVRLADEIHSVDTLALLETLERIAEREERRPRVYLQVKLSPEEAKHGFDPAAVGAAVERAARSPALELEGLMTMAPASDPSRRAATARATFDELAALAAALDAGAFRTGRPRLSMGMSGDFEQAIAAGADVIRVGSSLFEGLEPQPGALGG